MDEERIKQAVISAIERSDFARVLADGIGSAAEHANAPASAKPAASGASGASAASGAQTSGTQTLLTRIVLGDILDDTILGARPQDRTFPLRVFFSELGTMLARDESPEAHAAEQAFTLASGLNFFFRAEMDGEAKIRVGLEVSRQLYALASDPKVKIDADVVAKAAPLLATLMSTELERVRFESVDHAKVFDSQVHERTSTSDPTDSRILRPASFLCRVTANNTVKAKAQVVT
jgi:hypothetical protein